VESLTVRNDSGSQEHGGEIRPGIFSVDALTGSDPSLAQILRSKPITFVDVPYATNIRCSPMWTPSELVGQAISHYRVLEKRRGEGIGAVYKAEVRF
jgi:hypothetical protein